MQENALLHQADVQKKIFGIKKLEKLFYDYLLLPNRKIWPSSASMEFGSLSDGAPRWALKLTSLGSKERPNRRNS